jgi:hypothetical protein
MAGGYLVASGDIIPYSEEYGIIPTQEEITDSNNPSNLDTEEQTIETPPSTPTETL